MIRSYAKTSRLMEKKYVFSDVVVWHSDMNSISENLAKAIDYLIVQFLLETYRSCQAYKKERFILQMMQKYFIDTES